MTAKRPVRRVWIFVLLVLGGVSMAYAQKTTEIFIPLGQSPGLTPFVSYMGTIESVDERNRTFRADGRDVEVSADTQIWLDRTAIKATNIAGGFVDLQVGRRVQIKYATADRQVVEWIKIEIPGP